MSTDPIFGEGYTAERIELGVDAEGPLAATLIHRTADASAGSAGDERDAGTGTGSVPVLVMHGWSDYVLDRRLLEHLGERGHDVWALDLRKHGRSILPGQTPTAIDHLSRYDEEIDAALRRIGRDRPPVLLAHSTGGLIAALYALRHPGSVRALVLNSPWLEMHLGKAARILMTPGVQILAEHLESRPILPPGAPHLARSNHRSFGGEYDYDLALKPERGHRFPASTLAAVIDGQHRLAAAGPLALPVLVLHSTRSRIALRFHEDMRRADSVLDVRSMAAAAKHLGPRVQVVALDGARHDVFLSDADVRARAMEVMDAFLDARPWAEGAWDADGGAPAETAAPPGSPSMPDLDADGPADSTMALPGADAPGANPPEGQGEADGRPSTRSAPAG